LTGDRDYDVIVVGGGSSGVAAALGAARTAPGGRVLLIERYGFLGGTLTAALVAPMMTFHSPKEQVIRGIAQEIVDILMARGMSPGHVYDTTGYVPTVTPFDAEALKEVELELLGAAGVDLLLHSQVVGADVQGHRLCSITVQGKEGQSRFSAKSFVDATGDGDLAYYAGVDYEFGRPADNLPQPATLKFKMINVDIEAVKNYAAAHPGEFRLGERGVKGLLEARHISICGFFSLLEEAKRKGEINLLRDQVLFFSTPFPGEVIVNMSRVANLKDLSSATLTKAEIEARRQVHELVAFMQRRLPGFAAARLVATGAQIGLRESRRIKGLYRLSAEDVLSGRTFADQIACNAYPIDIHSPDGAEVVTMRINEGKSGRAYYGIPYRCLLNAQVENLLVTGRAISTTHEAHASTRLAPVCMAVGQAAGVGAAMTAGYCGRPGTAAKATERRKPMAAAEVDVAELQRTLMAQGAELGLDMA